MGRCVYERTFWGLFVDSDNNDRLLLVVCWQQWLVVVGWQQWPVVTDCCTVGKVAHATFVCATMVAGLTLCFVTNCFILFSTTIKEV